MGWIGHRWARLVGVVVVSTLVLTTSFVGVVALVSGGSDGLRGRLPIYVLLMAVAFVGVVFLAEQRQRRASVGGPQSVVTAGVAGLAVFAVSTLSGEGMVFAARNPGQVVLSELSLYFLATGLIGTGLGYWGLRHWREFARVSRPTGRL